jgi:hypothetical protein
MIAVGVSYSLPATQSPMAYMLGTDVRSSSPAMILPFGAVLTPTYYRFSSLVSAPRPMAKRTTSKISYI